MEGAFVLLWLVVAALLIWFTAYAIGLYRGAHSPEGAALVERFVRVARRVVVIGVIAYAVFIALVALGLLPGPIM